MSRYDWLVPIDAIFYEALGYHDLSGWFIEPIPNNVDTHLSSLIEGKGKRKEKRWPFRTHKGKGW